MRLILDMCMRYENGKLVFNSVIFFHMQLRLQKYMEKKQNHNQVSTGLYWTAVGCTGLYRFVLGCTGLKCTLLACAGQKLAVLGSNGLFEAALVCTGLYRTILGCTGQY